MPNDSVLTELMAIIAGEKAPRIQVSVSARGTVVTGWLVSRDAYLKALVAILRASGSEQSDCERIENAVREDDASLYLEHAKALSGAGSETLNRLWRIRMSDVDGFGVISLAPGSILPPQATVQMG
jgi:hypothetical protein